MKFNFNWMLNFLFLLAKSGDLGQNRCLVLHLPLLCFSAWGLLIQSQVSAW